MTSPHPQPSTLRDLLVVGIGSPHGDDAIGWLMTQGLEQQTLATRSVDFHGRVVFRPLRTPLDLVDLLDNPKGEDLPSRLVVIDAVVSPMPLGHLHVWVWPKVGWETRRASGSHDIPLADALAIAERLGRLPPCVEILGINVGEAPTTPHFGLSHGLRSLLPKIAGEVNAWLESDESIRDGVETCNHTILPSLPNNRVSTGQRFGRGHA